MIKDLWAVVMRKCLILFSLIVFLSSCSSTKEVAQEVVPAETIEVVEAPAEEAVVQEVVEQPVVVPEVQVPEQEPVPEVVETMEPVAKEPLTARDLVDQISGTIVQPEMPKEIVETHPVSISVAEVETPAVDDGLPEEESVAGSSIPAVAVSQETEFVPQVPEEGVDFDYVRIISIVITIILLFTAASIIRNRFLQPLSKSISLILALLFVAIPILIGTILTGWDTMYLLFLLLLSCYFVFRSKASNINYR